jgi:hypothetical protein
MRLDGILAFYALQGRSLPLACRPVKMAAMLRGPDGEIVWGVWDFVDWNAAVLVLLKYFVRQASDTRCLPTATGQAQNVCICPRASASNGERGQMQVICILLR